MAATKPVYDIRRVKRGGKTKTVITAIGQTRFAGLSGVKCLNPRACEANRVYQKTFRQKPIYLPDEYEKAVRAHLGGKNVIALAGNGYSDLPPEKEREWGVQPGGYVQACTVLFTETYRHITKKFPQAKVVFVHGASDRGVDLVLCQVAKKLHRPQMGFNCPEFMFYVADDDVPVYVAQDKEAYADAFVRSCDVLISANGRMHAYKMDYKAIFEYGKYVLPVNVLKSISSSGGPPASNPDGTINDAVAHLQERLFIIGQRMGMKDSIDPWADTVKEVRQRMTHICRRVLPAKVGLRVR